VKDIPKLMKKIFLLAFVAILTVVSCSDEIESNTPSIQGEVNGEFFRTKNTSATINEDGSLSITGQTDTETITLKTATAEIGAYALGSQNTNEATFQTLEGNFYSTGVDGMGQVEITKIQQGKISGEFYFDAVQDTEEDTLNFNKGFFFEIPLTNPGSGVEVPNCEETQTISEEARQVYEEADSNDQEAFEAACLAYKNALEDEIEACGDEDGSIQTIIDELPCGTSEEASIFTADIDGETKEFINIAGSTLGNYIRISGFSPIDSSLPYSIELVMPDNITPGTYTDYAQITGQYVWRYVEDGEEATAIGSSVSLEITNHDTANMLIEGTFEFEGDLNGEMRTITNGEFSVEYQ